jgi:epoxide hydrolase-like predicted phosphatase
MIKAFLFDWGGVMSKGGRGGELGVRFGHALDIEPTAAWQLLSLAWKDFSMGTIDELELWRRVEKAYGKPLSPSQRDIWNKWEDASLLSEMEALVVRLKQEGYAVGLVSNTIPVTAAEIRNHGGYAIFDFTILSCEVHCAKPDPAIYVLAMSKLRGIRPDETVFIDDQERCLEPARNLGMYTIQSNSAHQVIQDVEALIAQM